MDLHGTLKTCLKYLSLLLIFNVVIVARANEDGGFDEALWEMSLDDLMNMEVVSASKKAEKLTDVPSNMVVVTDQQIKEWGVKDLKDVLRRVVGYNVVADRDEWVFGARGNVSDNNQKYLVVLDGHRMYSINNFGPGNIIEMPMDLSNVKRIEIIKGPGAVVWGNAAISGVISIYTKDVADMGDTKTNIGVAAGSFDTYRANLQTGGEDSKGNQWMVMASGAQSSGKEVTQSSATWNRPILDTISSSYRTDNPHGTYRTDMDRQDPGYMVHAKGKVNKVDIAAFFMENSIFNRHYESRYDRLNFLENRKMYIEGVYYDEVGGGDFSAKMSVHHNYAAYDNRQEVVGLPPAQLEIEWQDNNVNLGLGYAKELTSKLFMNSGLEFTRTSSGPNNKWVGTNANNASAPGDAVGPNTVDVYPTATITYTPGSSVKDDNIFGYLVFDYLLNSDWKLVGGTGIDYSADRGKDPLAFSPRFASIWQINDSSTGKFVYNHAFLRPSNFQTGVEAEEMDQFELIYMKRLGNTNLTATAYWQKLTGFITIVGIGSGFQNSGDYTSSGIELEVTSKVYEDLDLWGNTSYMWIAEADNIDPTIYSGTKTNTVRTDSSGELLSVPKFQFNLGATWRALQKQVFVSPALRFVGEVTYRATPPTQGDTTLNSATHSKINPMTYVDLALGYEPSKHLGFYLTFMNLFDEKRQNHLTIWNGTVGQTGRYAELKAIFKF